MPSRRNLLRLCALGGASAALGLPQQLVSAQQASPVLDVSPASAGWQMPDEGAAHKATWMTFQASPAIWGNKADPVKAALAAIANTIVDFEPVNMLVSPEQVNMARRKLDARINVIVQESDDLWTRDTGAVFVNQRNGTRAAINFNFNGWGQRQRYARDALIAPAMARLAGVSLLKTHLVLEAGGIEVDGRGTAIISESCVLNANRNPGLEKVHCEAELARLLGIRKVIWLPGIANKDITDGHTDFYARFAGPGVVVVHNDPDTDSWDYSVTRRHQEILNGATDADNKKLQLIVIDAPTRTRIQDENFAAGYVNFYLLNGAVLLPEFGDMNADAEAKAALASAFPGRAVIALNIDPIARGGGGIHCTTQQEPAAVHATEL